MRHLIAAIGFLATSLAAQASCPSPHFEPSAAFGVYGSANVRTDAENSFAPPPDWAETVLYYEETGKWDKDFGADYSVALLRRESDGEGLLVLRRWRDDVQVASHVRVSKSDVVSLVAQVEPELGHTRYDDAPCGIPYTDGFMAAMSVVSDRSHVLGILAGEVYNPPEDSEAGRAVAMGRSLRARALAADVSR